MAETLADIAVIITADSRKLTSGLKNARGSLMKFSGAAPALLKGVTTAIVGMGAAATAAAAAFSALAIKGVTDFAKFGHEMAGVSTMIRTNVEQNTKALSHAVRQLSLDIPQSTSTLTGALYDILSASVPVSKSMKVLGSSAKAAIAGMSDVQTAANLATGTMNALGMEFKDTKKVLDTAFATVRSGKITFTELAGSLGQVLPSATKMNSSITEVYGSIAFLTKNAFNAEMASVSLARALDALGEKSEDLENMGIRVFGEEGQYVGLVKVIEQIADKLKGLSAEAKVNVLAEMGFDIRAARAITTMASNLDAFRDTMGEVTDSAGAMEDAFGRMKDTMINQWQSLKNSFAELSKSIGAGFKDIASEAIKRITKLVDAISGLIGAGGGLTNLWKNHRDFVIGIFASIASAGVAIMAEMARAIADIFKTYLRVAWEDFVVSAKNIFESGFRPIISTFQNLPKLVTEGFGAFNEAMKQSGEKWDKEWEKHKETQKTATKEIVENLAKRAANIVKIISDSMSELEANLAAQTKKLKAQTEELATSLEDVAEAAKEVAETGTKSGKWLADGLKVARVGALHLRAAMHDLAGKVKYTGVQMRVLGGNAKAFFGLAKPTEAAWKTAFRNITKEQTDWVRKWEDGIRTVQGAFSDLMFDFVKDIDNFKDSWDSFCDHLKNSFIRSITDMLADAAVKKLFAWLLGEDVTGGGGGGGPGTGGGGGGSTADVVKDTAIKYAIWEAARAAGVVWVAAAAAAYGFWKILEDVAGHVEGWVEDWFPTGEPEFGKEIRTAIKSGFSGRFKPIEPPSFGGIKPATLPDGGMGFQPSLAPPAPGMRASQGRGGTINLTVNTEVSFPNADLEHMSKDQFEALFTKKIVPAIKDAAKVGVLNEVLAY